MFPFTPDNDFAHLVQCLRDTDSGGIAKRLQIYQSGVEFPQIDQKGTIEF